MQILSSTFIALPLVAAILLWGPRTGILILFGLLPMGMMAAFNLPAIGGTTILASDLAVLALLALLFLRPGGFDLLARVFSPGSPGLSLLAFFGYAVIATMFLPRIFEGATEVFSLSRSANEDGIVANPLRPGTGNLSQLLRMTLGISVFTAAVAFAIRYRDPKLALRAVQVASVVHIGMGLLDILTNGAGMPWLLDWARTGNYALTLGQKMAGFNRMIGGFPEASSYGYFSLGLLGFWTSYWLSGRDRTAAPTIFFVLTLFVVLRGTSSSAYVGAALLAMVFLMMSALDTRRTGLSVRAAAIGIGVSVLIPILCVTVVILYQTAPTFTNFVDQSLLNKLDSESGLERASWNMQALRNFLDTNLLGAGLGSVRASNWVVAVLATTGLPGMILMFAFLWRLFTFSQPGTDPEAKRIELALKMACVGFLARAVVVKASPSLDYGFFAAAGLATGLVAAQFPLRQRKPHAAEAPL
ncbi:MAG: hypothetical protein AAF801_01515 [Pseudomonadota bacterium]